MVQAAAEVLNAGADPNIPSNELSLHGALTPLEMAIKNGNIVICRLLLIADAKPSLMKTPLKGKAWFESISFMLKSKNLLHSQTTVDFVTLAEDWYKLTHMTFSDKEFIEHCSI